MNAKPVSRPQNQQQAVTARKVAMSPGAIWTLARDAASAWIDDFAPSMGAAISYYTVFSIAPLLLIVIAIAGIVLGPDAASGRIFAELEGFIGKDGAAAIQGMVKSANSPAKSAFGTITGVVTLLIGATTVFAELQSALDRIWRTPAAEKAEGLWKLIRTRFLSFGMILAIGFLLLVSLVVSAGIAALGSLWAPVFEGWTAVLQILNFVVSAAIITVLFAVIYKYLPRARIGWHDVWIGAAVTAVLFSIGKLLIGLYIGKSGVVSGFGAAGSLVVVLLWVYYSSQIFLLGAEFTWLYAYRFGSRRGEKLEPAPEASKSRGETAADRGLPGVPATATAAVAANDSDGEPRKAHRKRFHAGGRNPGPASKPWLKTGGAVAAAFTTGWLLDAAARHGALDWMRARWARLVH